MIATTTLPLSAKTNATNNALTPTDKTVTNSDSMIKQINLFMMIFPIG